MPSLRWLLAAAHVGFAELGAKCTGFEFTPSVIFCPTLRWLMPRHVPARLPAMSKNTTKRQGRPAIGKSPVIGLRMSPKLLQRVDAVAADNFCGRSAAIRILVTKGLRHHGFENNHAAHRA
jgi:hypothetical protein